MSSITSKQDIHYWLAAVHLPGIGPITLRRWLDYFLDIKTLFSASTLELQQAGFKSHEIKLIKNPNWKAVEKDIAWSQKLNCHLISRSADNYPILLREIASAPSVLYVQGDVSVLDMPQLAMVGTRNPSVSGRETAEQFASYLVQAGLAVTSGLALGIDAACHQGALSANGRTVAVFGTGLNQIYPRSHKKLAHQILEQGALVSEFSPDTLPIAKHFPQRNRIISGLSLGVLVIEAALKSGSLITARYAIEQGRDVFALPGSIHNPVARGCHYLIQQGAKLVETAQDIIEELGALRAVLPTTHQPIVIPSNLPSQHQTLLALMGYEATALDTLIVRSGLTASEVSSILLSLELQGHVRAVRGGYVCLKC